MTRPTQPWPWSTIGRPGAGGSASPACRVRWLGDAQPGSAPAQPATRPATPAVIRAWASRRRSATAAATDRRADLAERDARSPLAAAAGRVIDEITMWYLGSVPHQPDVPLVFADLTGDVTD